jgi:hypothetical protein
MELEEQVCSLEVAKGLRELGAKQESLFIWVDGKKPYVREGDMKGCSRCGAVINGIMPPRSVPTYCAFTVAELGEMLPIEYVSQRRPCGPLGAKTYQYGCGHYDHDWQCFADTEAEARAKMLVSLLENHKMDGERGSREMGQRHRSARSL